MTGFKVLENITRGYGNHELKYWIYSQGAEGPEWVNSILSQVITITPSDIFQYFKTSHRVITFIFLKCCFRLIQYHEIIEFTPWGFIQWFQIIEFTPMGFFQWLQIIEFTPMWYIQWFHVFFNTILFAMKTLKNISSRAYTIKQHFKKMNGIYYFFYIQLCTYYDLWLNMTLGNIFH